MSYVEEAKPIQVEACFFQFEWSWANRSCHQNFCLLLLEVANDPALRLTETAVNP